MSETTALQVVSEPSGSVGGYVAALQRMASDPATDVVKMQAMFAMQMEAMRYSAEVEFNAAMARLQPLLPAIVKTKENTNTHAKYAEYHNLVKVVRPLASAEGFSWSFNTEPMLSGQTAGMLVSGELMHSLGHKKQFKIWVPNDTGPGRSAVQAIGSSMTYAERYLVKAMFGLVEIGADDDGNGGKYDPLTRDHVDDLTTLIRDAKLGVKAVEQFCSIYNVKTINQIPDLMFADAVARINNRTAR